jgi:aldose 1-epimerase
MQKRGNLTQVKYIFKGSGKDEHRTAFCLEMQQYPGLPKEPSFPSIVLSLGQTIQRFPSINFQLLNKAVYEI